MAEPIVTRDQIAAAIRRVGLRAGDLAFYHSSLRSFGQVHGAADAVVDAMLDVLGPTGTLAAPAFTFSLKMQPAPIFDLLHSPCEVGAIAEALRHRPGARRSRHLTHSVVAIGPRADELTSRHSVTPCGADSPFARLLAWDAAILLLGVDQNANTCMHAVEEEVALPRVGYRQIADAKIRDENGASSPLPSQVHDSHPKYDFNPADRPLYDCGAMAITTAGNAIIRLIRSRAMRRWTIDALRRDPAFLTIRGDAWAPRPTRADQLDAF